jgi:predicted DNA-binding antitoxin AbrB/MazE fold protein
MTITVEATYENGQLKFKEPVALAEGTAVRVTITPMDDDYDPFDAVIGICKDGPSDGAENHDKYIYGDKGS